MSTDASSIKAVALYSVRVPFERDQSAGEFFTAPHRVLQFGRLFGQKPAFGTTKKKVPTVNMSSLCRSISGAAVEAAAAAPVESTLQNFDD